MKEIAYSEHFRSIRLTTLLLPVIRNFYIELIFLLTFWGFTGHSLGAGTAVLLSMMLKPKYPKIRCFAFSPPGGLLNQAAARYTETFCMSVIIGDDLVPRLSLVTLELLKNQLVSELDACRHPKVRWIKQADSFFIETQFIVFSIVFSCVAVGMSCLELRQYVKGREILIPFLAKRRPITTLT